MKNVELAKNVANEAEAFYKDLKNDENGRYRSWEHCYTIFHKFKGKKPSEDNRDLLCLHLAFYLASWGMYRGSSFLLQQDYKVHGDIIDIIFDKRYSKLFGADCEALDINLLMEVSEKIRQKYSFIRKKVYDDMGKKVNTPVSDTLVTKVLMGTFGCVPAYDRYFISGVVSNKITTQNYNKESIKRLVQFYSEHFEIFEECRSKMNVNGLAYPQMKILDMGFWQIGLPK